MPEHFPDFEGVDPLRSAEEWFEDKLQSGKNFFLDRFEGLSVSRLFSRETVDDIVTFNPIGSILYMGYGLAFNDERMFKEGMTSLLTFGMDSFLRVWLPDPLVDLLFDRGLDSLSDWTYHAITDPTVHTDQYGNPGGTFEKAGVGSNRRKARVVKSKFFPDVDRIVSEQGIEYLLETSGYYETDEAGYLFLHREATQSIECLRCGRRTHTSIMCRETVGVGGYVI